jgi:TPP-dependent pyruvate/acetoin dehydrogenase alpha subunit
MTPEKLIQAEQKLVDLWEDGEVNSLIHFSGSTDGHYEEWICRLFQHAIKPGDYILCSHRCHFHFLLYTYYRLLADDSPEGSPSAAWGHAEAHLIEQVLAGRSMFLFGPRFIQSAIVGGLCGVAAGLALSVKQRGTGEHIHHFCGDGAVCQGAFWEAAMFVEQNKLPATFLVESNSRQCGVPMDNSIRQHLAGGLKCVVWHEYSPKFSHAGNDTRPPLKSQSPPKFLVDMAKR